MSDKTLTAGLERHSPPTVGRSTPGATTAAGGFYLTMGGIHVGIVAANAETYRHFADSALLGFVRSGWADIFMAHAAAWGLLLAAGEITLGVILLRGGPAARWGWVGILAFQVLLMLFGWGFWLWSVPALAVLYGGARSDWGRLGVPNQMPAPERKKDAT